MPPQSPEASQPQTKQDLGPDVTQQQQQQPPHTASDDSKQPSAVDAIKQRLAEAAKSRAKGADQEPQSTGG